MNLPWGRLWIYKNSSKKPNVERHTYWANVAAHLAAQPSLNGQLAKILVHTDSMIILESRDHIAIFFDERLASK